MNLRIQTLAAWVTVLLSTSTFAQTSFPEIEPNSQRPEATAATGMTAGDSLTGTTTGTTTTLGSTLLTSADVFRVKTTALPLGIYQHRLTLTSNTVGHTGSIRGLSQTGQTGTASTGGTPSATDVALQTSAASSTPPRMNQWYGFGKQEELYYRVAGAAATTDTYTATLSTTPVAPTVIVPTFESGSPITISSRGLTTVDTDILVFDSNLDGIPGFNNDDEGPALPSIQSRLTRTFAPGTYYLAIGRSNTAWSFGSPADDDFFSNVMDFPGSAACSSLTPTTTTDDRDFRIAASNGVFDVSNQVVGPDSFSIQWYQFTVAAGAPPIPAPPAPANDTCATPTPLPSTAATTTGDLAGATNDGTATCDPSGALGRDVWYSYTNVDPFPRILGLSTCTTDGVSDTVLSVYNSCGGTELGCSDDSPGCSALPLMSSIQGLLLAPSQTVLIRVSDKGLGGTDRIFRLVSTISAPVPSNDDCSTPIVIGPGTYPFDTSGATTGAQGQGTTPGCNTTSSVKKDLWYTYTPSVTGTVTFSTCGGTTSINADTKVSYYLGAGCPAAPSPVGCDDDACVTPLPETSSILIVPVTCGSVITFQLGNFSSTPTINIFGTFMVSEGGTACNTPFTVFCAGDAVGTTCVACGNNGAANKGCANSAFAGGTQLVSGGNASVGTDTLTLTTSDMTGPGLFFQASGLSASPISFGDGMLCAGVNIQRLGVVFPVAGSATYPGGLTPNPISVGGAPIAAGDTKHYQVWYRDSDVFCTPSTFNTSNGVTLVWTP